MKQLAGRVAVITGASKGLGKAIAVALGGAGVRIALISRNREQLENTAAAVRSARSSTDPCAMSASRSSTWGRI